MNLMDLDYEPYDIDKVDFPYSAFPRFSKYCKICYQIVKKWKLNVLIKQCFYLLSETGDFTFELTEKRGIIITDEK